METSIGFRMNFEKMGYEQIEKTIKQYCTLFERYEIKTTISFIETENMKNVITLSQKYLKGKFSIHLPKNILEDKQALKKSELLLLVLQDVNYTGNLVTHIPLDIDIEKYKSILESFSRMLPNKSFLLLENIVVEDNIKYLMKINELFEFLEKAKISNVKICLDFGHLMFSFHKQNKSQNEALQELDKNKNILLNVKELHLHDFNGELDHIPLGEGVLDLENLAQYLIKHQLSYPIIIEVSISNPRELGYEQVKMVRLLLTS